MLRRHLVVFLAIALSSVFALARPATAGGAVPFKGTLEGRLTSRTPVVPPVVFDVFNIRGNATHLGAYTLIIEAVVNFGSLPPTATGTFTFTAASGDKLVAVITGSSALVVPGVVLITEHATIDPDRSTGRFAGARGTFRVERLADAATGVNGVTAGSFTGTITLDHD